MTFIATLIAVTVDRLFAPLDEVRDTTWFSGYFHFMGTRLMGISMFSGTLGALVAALIPVAFIAIVLLVIHEAGTLLEGIAGILVLAFMLGPRNLHAEIEAYIAAVNEDNEERAQQIADKLLHGNAPKKHEERCGAVIRAALIQANDRVFAVVFWFVLLGPLGAVFFRGAELLRHKLAREFGEDSEFADASARLHGVMAWLPARLLALSYAFAGSFEEALADWRAYYEDCAGRFFQISNDVLGCAGSGAVRLAMSTKNTEMEFLHATDNLIFRSEVLWLSMIGLLTLVGWV